MNIYYLEAKVNVGMGRPLMLGRMAEPWRILLLATGRMGELGCLWIR